MWNHDDSFFLTRRHRNQAILLVALLILPRPTRSQAIAGGKSETIKVEVIHNLIVMPGYVNNSPKLDVALDTGASVSFLAPAWAAKLKLKSVMSEKTAGIGKGQDKTAQIFSGVSLAWGIDKTFILDGQMVASLPIDYVSQLSGHQVSAIFGSSLFQNFRVRVNYEENEVTFSSGDTPPVINGTAIPIKLYDDAPYVEAVFETASGEKVPALFLVDTGTAGDLILNKNFLDAHPSIAMGHPWVPVPPGKTVGGTVALKALRISGLGLGPFHLAGPIAAVPDEPLGALANHGIAGFIGAGVLSRFTVDWNYRGLTMTLTPNHLFGAPFEGDASGLRLVAEKPDWKTIRVEAVTKGSPAAVAGVQAGDILQKVNGEAPPALYELEKLLVHPGSSILITILRSGKQRTMTIHLCRLV